MEKKDGKRRQEKRKSRINYRSCSSSPFSDKGGGERSVCALFSYWPAALTKKLVSFLSGTNLFSSPSSSPLGCERVKRRKKFLPGGKEEGKKCFWPSA